MSGSRSERVRRRLEAQGRTVEVDTRLGRGGRRARYAILTSAGYELLGEKPPKGRGGPVHKHFASVIADWASQNGYQVTTEARLESGWVDLHLERAGQATAVEVSITSTPQREMKNIAKCLQQGYDGVVVLFLDRHTLEDAGRLLSLEFSDEELKKVTLGRLDEFYSLL
jgi:hypothetical protein